MTKWIRISLNPSSWFANQFVDFYNETYEKNYHFQVTTAGVQSVMERVRDYMDDIGFVYILSQQKENFLHELCKKQNAVSIPMYETDVMSVPGTADRALRFRQREGRTGRPGRNPFYTELSG